MGHRRGRSVRVGRLLVGRMGGGGGGGERSGGSW